MQDMSQLTHVGRPVDPRYPTNRAISIINIATIVVMFVFQLVKGTPIIDAGLHAIAAGLTMFVVWAFAREIDPEEQLSAFVAVLLALILLFTVDAGYNLIVLFYLIGIARVINRSVGLPLKLSDSVLLLGATILVAYLSGWIYALIGAIAFLLDSILPEPDLKHRLFAGLSLLVMLVVMWIQGIAITLMMPSQLYLIVIVLAGLIFIPVIWSSRQLTVVCDIRGQTLSPIRVQVLQILILVVALVIAFTQGDEGVLSYRMVWIALAGVGLFPLIKPFLPDINLEMRES